MTSIHTAILAVTAALEPIQKNGTLELGGKAIPFTRIDDIRDALNPLLVEHGIVSYINVDLVKHDLQVAAEPMTMVQFDENKNLLPGREVRDGRVPNTRSWALVKVTFTFILAADDATEDNLWSSSALGEAYDTNGDKALAKATTAAVKRILSEVFKVTDHTEGDAEGADPDAGNRAATTDRREGGDRGNQARAAAQQSQATGSSRRTTGRRPQAPAAETPEPAQPSDEAVAAADESTGEVPDEAPAPQEPPAPSKLDAEKARVRVAVGELQKRDGKEAWSQAAVDALATEVTGKKARADWITLQTAVKKLADALEAKL